MDQFLVRCEIGLSRSQIERLIDEGLVTRNGQAVKTSTKLKVGDEVVVERKPEKPLEPEAQDIDLDIAFEDEHLIVINKAAGMVVHPSPGHEDETLVNALLHHCGTLSTLGGEERPGIVHRIDKDTSGLMVACKSDEAHRALAAGFKNKSHHRIYHAVSSPGPKLEEMRIDTAFGRHPVNRKKFSTKGEHDKRAVTHLRVLERFSLPAALLELRLETGRTHQIRVHCAESGFSLLGDPMYGRAPKNPELRAMGKALGRQALHASELGFVHPTTGEELRFRAEFPADFQTLLSGLRSAG